MAEQKIVETEATETKVEGTEATVEQKVTFGTKIANGLKTLGKGVGKVAKKAAVPAITLVAGFIGGYVVSEKRNSCEITVAPVEEIETEDVITEETTEVNE